MLNESKDVYPTAFSALLLRLYMVETGRQGEFDPLRLIEWWTEKLENPDEGDAWLSRSMWRLYSRHIHALISANFPCLSEASGHDLGIETQLISKPEIMTHPNGIVSEYWSVEAYARSLPPFGFETWQRPLKCTRFYPCDPDELNID